MINFILKMITISYVNFWIDPKNDDYFTKFISYNIGETKIVNSSDNPDILITSVFGNINNVINVKAKCKIFYYGENLNFYPPYNNDKLLENIFDLIIGFRYTNLDKKILRFPLWLMYYNFYTIDTNTTAYTTTDNTNIINYIENKYKQNKNKNKSIFATLISSHDRGGQRTKICNGLSKHESSQGKIMCAGNFNNNTSKIGPYCQDKINYISQGIYNICPENSSYEGYFTEKIFQALEAGTIPLYWAVDLPEKGLINENKYCFCNINNEKELQDSIDNVIANPKKYLEGNVFSDNAINIIQGYYNDLRDNIKIKLGL